MQMWSILTDVSVAVVYFVGGILGLKWNSNWAAVRVGKCKDIPCI